MRYHGGQRWRHGHGVLSRSGRPWQSSASGGSSWSAPYWPPEGKEECARTTPANVSGCRAGTRCVHKGSVRPFTAGGPQRKLRGVAWTDWGPTHAYQGIVGGDSSRGRPDHCHRKRCVVSGGVVARQATSTITSFHNPRFENLPAFPLA